MSVGRPLRITWVLPFLRFTGGVRVVYEHSRELRRRGHEVRIVAPRGLEGAFGRRSVVDRLRDALVDRVLQPVAPMLRFYGLGDCVHRVPALDPRHFPDGDVLLATSWHTAAPVAAAAARSGRGAYFIQHYEAFEPALVEPVDATWRLPLEKIVIASWLKRLGQERFGARTWGPVINGVDFDLFHAEGRAENPSPVVGMLYERIPWKGTEDGFEAVRIARGSVPGLALHMYGHHRMRHALAPGDRYQRSPSQQRLSAIYRECDLFLSPSWTEGCQLPPMEAMASGCAVVATNVGGVPDYAISGVTALTAPPHEPEALARHLVALATDPGLRERVARAGREHIARFTWPRATGELEAALTAIARGEGAV
jgi:glycosyltransferase involved in cell wall biosynthesis